MRNAADSSCCAIHEMETDQLLGIRAPNSRELVFIHPPTPSVNTNVNLEYHEYQSATPWLSSPYWYSLMTPHP